MDFHKRWDPAYCAMRNEIIEDGEKIIRGYVSLDDIISVPTKWFTWTDSSSPSWFVGVHCYDLIWYLSGSEVKSVYAGVEPMQEFISDILTGKKFRATAYDGLQATRIAEAVHESVKTGNVICL